MATPRKDPKDYLRSGQPTKYKPEYCDLIIEQATQGKTISEFAASVKCDVKSVYNWSEAHPEFFQAIKRAEPLREQWWVNVGKGMMTGQIAKSSASIYIWMTKNILKWRDRQDLELSGKDGGPINFSNLSDAELEAQINSLVEQAKRK